MDEMFQFIECSNSSYLKLLQNVILYSSGESTRQTPQNEELESLRKENEELKNSLKLVSSVYLSDLSQLKEKNWIIFQMKHSMPWIVWRVYIFYIFYFRIKDEEIVKLKASNQTLQRHVTQRHVTPEPREPEPREPEPREPEPSTSSSEPRERPKQRGKKTSPPETILTALNKSFRKFEKKEDAVKETELLRQVIQKCKDREKKDEEAFNEMTNPIIMSDGIFETYKIFDDFKIENQNGDLLIQASDKRYTFKGLDKRHLVYFRKQKPNELILKLSVTPQNDEKKFKSFVLFVNSAKLAEFVPKNERN